MPMPAPPHAGTHLLPGVHAALGQLPHLVHGPAAGAGHLPVVSWGVKAS